MPSCLFPATYAWLVRADDNGLNKRLLSGRAWFLGKGGSILSRGITKLEKMKVTKQQSWINNNKNEEKSITRVRAQA